MKIHFRWIFIEYGQIHLAYFSDKSQKFNSCTVTFLEPFFLHIKYLVVNTDEI